VARDTASQINYDDILNMWSRRYIGSKDYVWFVAPEAAAQLPQMLNGTIPAYMPPGGLSGQQYGTLMGRPVIETEYNPTLNAIGDILLASMSQYQAIDKGNGVQVATSIHVAFVTDEQAFRFVYRVDGAPLWSSVLTPANGSALTVTPFVALSAACAT
jgi:HK97 family phage major capsid protein